MLIWGGYDKRQAICFADGGSYSPGVDAWEPIPATPLLSARKAHAAVWTGEQLLIWGGRNESELLGDGALYDPIKKSWSAIHPVGAPTARYGFSLVWTGRQAIIWGGQNDKSLLADGASYSPETGRWTPISQSGAPSPRYVHTAIWTGSRMLVWGGSQGRGYAGRLGDGAAYDPEADCWEPLPDEDAPCARYSHSAVWTGSRMLIWGGWGCGQNRSGNSLLCQDGALYDPVEQSWESMSMRNAPTPRQGASLVWTSEQALLWGGTQELGHWLGDGASYDPECDRWHEISDEHRLAPRWQHSAVWTGQKLLIWGGEGDRSLADGASYDPEEDS